MASTLNKSLALAIKVLSLSYHATPGSTVTSSVFPSSGHAVSLCHPMCVGGGVKARGHRVQTQRGNQSILSLCDSISRLCTHEWMPRHLSSEPRNKPRLRTAAARVRLAGRAEEHTNTYAHGQTKGSEIKRGITSHSQRNIPWGRELVGIRLTFTKN